MQMHSSYVVTDPKGTILVECGIMLQRGAPKLGKDGKPMKDKRGKVIYEPYQIRVLNTINFKKSMHYNPFAYILSLIHISGARWSAGRPPGRRSAGPAPRLPACWTGRPRACRSGRAR